MSKLDDLAVTLSQFAGNKTVAPTSLPEQDAIALKNLRATGRDFFAETGALKATIVARLKAAIKGGQLSQAAWNAIVAQAVKEHVVARFANGGGDVSLRPLSPEYRRFKARHGYDSRIGIKTGHLLATLRAARWVVR